MYAFEELTNRQRDELLTILIKKWGGNSLTLAEELRVDQLLEQIYYDD